MSTVLGELYAKVNGKRLPVIISLELFPTNQKQTNTVVSFDVLYSINTKTEPAGSLSPDVPTEVDYPTGSTISIADLLKYVNKYYPYEVFNKSSHNITWIEGKRAFSSYDEAQNAINTLDDKDTWSKRLSTTREVAEYAQKNGYDSIVFKDIHDNGGNNVKVHRDTISDVYVVFNPNNVKSADSVTYDDNGNVIPLSERFNEAKSDIRYQARNSNSDYDFSKALNKKEWASFYSSLQKSNQREAFRVGNNGILIPDEKNSNNYKLVCYEGDSINPHIKAIYKLENYDYNIHDGSLNVAQTIIDTMEENFNDKQTKSILQDYANMYKTIFKRYNNASGRFVDITRKSISNRKNDRQKSNRTGVSENAGQGVSDSRVNDSVDTSAALEESLQESDDYSKLFQITE